MKYRIKSVYHLIILLTIFVLFYVFILNINNGKVKPDIILISIDTLRKDGLGCYGGQKVKTPFLDSISEKSLKLNNVFTPITCTTASHASMFTGLYPWNNGCRGNENFPLKNVTLSEILAGHGYLTAGFVSSWTLWRKFNINKGFKYYNDNLPGDMNRRDGMSTNTVFAEWIENNLGKKQPLFLFIHYFDCHAVYNSSEPSEDMFYQYANDMKTVFYKDGKYVPMYLKKWYSKYDSLKEAAMEYYKGPDKIDIIIKNLFSILKRSGLLKGPSLIIITADHGESLGEDNYYFDHVDRVTEPVIAIPMMIYPVNIKKFENHIFNYDGLIMNTDIFPTVLKAAGIEYDRNKFDGISLIPLLKGNKKDLRKYIESEAGYYRMNLFYPTAYRGISSKPRCIRSISEKLSLYPGYKYRYENFETNEDRWFNDIPGDNRIKSLMNIFKSNKKWQDELKEKNGVKQNLTPRQKNKLKSLGYFN